MIEELISINQAAKILHVTPMTIRNWIAQDWIPSYRIGPKLLRLYLKDVRFLRVSIYLVKQQRPFENPKLHLAGAVAQRIKYPSQSL